MEKLALAIVSGERKLRPYFQTYIITVQTNYLLLHTLRKSDVSGRFTKWSIELSEYDVRFVTTKSIKAQVLVDFVVDLISIEGIVEKWNIFVDR